MLQALHQSFDGILAKAMKERKKRQEFVPDPHDTHANPAWVLFERQAMFDAVNAERSARGKPPIPITEVVRVERSACGHVDYQRKFAFYCAELVLGEWRARQPKNKNEGPYRTPYGSPATLRPFEYKGSSDIPDGCYDGHDLSKVGIQTVFSVGETPEEAIKALCHARLGEFGGTLTELPSADPYTWGYSFTADGTSCKAAGIHVPGGVVLTWFK